MGASPTLRVRSLCRFSQAVSCGSLRACKGISTNSIFVNDMPRCNVGMETMNTYGRKRMRSSGRNELVRPLQGLLVGVDDGFSYMAGLPWLANGLG
jgi:hypothetical protein